MYQFFEVTNPQYIMIDHFTVMIVSFIDVLILIVLSYAFCVTWRLPHHASGKYLSFLSIALLILQTSFITANMNLSKWNAYQLLLFITSVMTAGLVLILSKYLYQSLYDLSHANQKSLMHALSDSYIYQMKNEYHKIKKIQHDIKNNMIILQELLNQNQINEAKTMLQDYQNNISKTSLKSFTNNIIIDGYFNHVISKK